MNIAQEALKNTNEYKEVQRLKHEVKNELSRLETVGAKEALMELGFECRSNYEVELRPENIQECIEDYSHVIIHSSRPMFKLVLFENSYTSGLNIEYEGNGWSEDWTHTCLGIGSNEDEAWKDAIGMLSWNWETKGFPFN